MSDCIDHSGCTSSGTGANCSQCCNSCSGSAYGYSDRPCHHPHHPVNPCCMHASCMPGCANPCALPPWAQPIYPMPTPYAGAASAGSATLVIHKIVLEPCGNQSCTPRTFSIRITGPSYPAGEVFRLRAGSCLELDEPLVLTGLQAGTYCIEELFATPNAYVSTITGPACGHNVHVTGGYFPTVITIVNRKRLCRLCYGSGCGCAANHTCR
ncbi:MAG: hypothetical protein IKB82_03030 [Clostridia bacterium]|nr:hypothetical protein [Clostridia bacterium]